HIAEIAIPFLQRRYIGNSWRGAEFLALHLEADEEERFIAALIEFAEWPEDFLGEHNRPTEGATRVIELSRRFLPGQRGRVLSPEIVSEAVVGSQGLVASVVIERAVVFAAAGLSLAENLHGAVAMLGGEVAGLDRHFLNEVVVEADDAAAVASDVDHARAVNADVVLLPALAVDVVLPGVAEPRTLGRIG